MTALFGWPLLDAVFYLALLGLLVEIDQGSVKSPKHLPQAWMLLGLWVASIFSHLAHTYFAGIMFTWDEVLKICFFTLLLISILDHPKRLRAVAGLFVFMACTMAVHAILQQTRGYGFAYQRPLPIPEIGNKPAHLRSMFFGIFSDPNDLAQILVTAMPFSFVLLKRKSFLSFLIGCGVTWLLVVAALHTHSRGGYVAMATMAGVMFVLLLPARWMPVLLVLLTIGGLAATPLSVGFLDASAHDRVVYWGLANQVFIHNPIFGIGFNMFWQVADGAASHNAFVLAYTEIGLFGYWFWFMLIFVGLLGVVRTRITLTGNRNPDAVWLRMYAGMSLAGMSGFLAGAYFLSRAFVYPLFFLMAMLGSVTELAQEHLPEGHPPLVDAKKDILILGSFVTFGSIVYIYLSIIFLNKAFY